MWAVGPVRATDTGQQELLSECCSLVDKISEQQALGIGADGLGSFRLWVWERLSGIPRNRLWDSCMLAHHQFSFHKEATSFKNEKRDRDGGKKEAAKIENEKRDRMIENEKRDREAKLEINKCSITSRMSSEIG